MNVLYLTTNPNRGSTTSPTEGWFRVLHPQRLRPVVALSHRGPFSQWLSAQDIPTYHLDLTSPSASAPVRFARTQWHLITIARRHRIQIIHCNEQITFATGRHLARLLRIPIVVSVHFPMERPYCEWLFRNYQPSRVFFVSHGCREASAPAFQDIIPESRWRTLNNGLDLEHYTTDSSTGDSFRREYNLLGSQLIGNACAIRPVKNLEHLIDAAAHLPENVKVVLAGGPLPQEEEYATSLLHRANETLGSRFICVGWQRDLRPMMNSLDLFVNTSHAEACSISVLEALACGCPVIGYPSKSVDKQVLPGGGEIVPQGNIESLTNSIRHWLANPILREHGATCARQRVVEDFDIQKSSAQLLHEYHDIIRSY